MKNSAAVIVTASGKRGFLETFGIEVTTERGNAIGGPIGDNRGQSP
jgi:hypothetical protein